MRFIVKGYRQIDGVVSLACEAATIEEARAKIVSQGIDIISIDAARFSLPSMAKQADFDLLIFSQELRSLTSAGLSLIETLTALSRKESASRKRDIIVEIIRQVREGKAFSESLKAFPNEFPTLYLSLISASEHTGNIGHALDRFISYQTRLDEIRKKVVAATLYPALLLMVGGAVILFLLFYVVPRFTTIYEDFGRDLPFMSRMLLEWGQFVSRYSTILLGGFFGIAVYVSISVRRNGHGLAGAFRNLPIIRDRVARYDLARFYRTIGMLQQGGITLTTALEMSSRLLGENFQASFNAALYDIRTGQPISSSMAAHNLAPPVALDLLRVGERTGELGEKMIRIADFYDEEQARWIEWFTRLFEPLLMLAIGLIIALVIVLLYMPIFELAETLQ